MNAKLKPARLDALWTMDVGDFPTALAWLADGAHIYVCGDAKRMAKDVERALVDVVAQYGARSTDDAVAFFNALKKSGRYQQDVY